MYIIYMRTRRRAAQELVYLYCYYGWEGTNEKIADQKKQMRASTYKSILSGVTSVILDNQFMPYSSCVIIVLVYRSRKKIEIGVNGIK